MWKSGGRSCEIAPKQLTAVDRGGKVMEMLVKMAEVLVKIAVMMMVATAAFRRHQKRRGEGGPFVFFFLDLLRRWEKGFPSGPWPPWCGRGESQIGRASCRERV